MYIYCQYYINKNCNSLLSKGRPLFHMGLHILQTHHLISYWNLDIMKVMKFLGRHACFGHVLQSYIILTRFYSIG